MKKIFVTLFIFFVSMVQVSANELNSVKMDIYLDQNGTAHVTETWDATYNENTEGYKGYGNVGNSKFSNFSVTMDGSKQFTFQDYWNINGSFDDKKYKNGFNYTDNGVELCFGISDYGTHTYEMKYDISDFVLQVNDAQIVYWTLFPDNFKDKVGLVYIKMHSDFKYEDNLDVWGYGNYGGTAYVYDGYIEVQSDGDLDTDEYMTVLIKFPPATFKTENIDADHDFAYFHDMAEKGATHYVPEESKESFFEKLMNILYFIFPLLIIIIGLIKGSKSSYYKGGFNKLNKDAPMFRDIPCKGDIYKAFFVASSYGLTKKETDFLGAVLLRWLKESQITIKKTEGKGLFKKEETSISFDNVQPINELEKELYHMMYEASVDGVLEENEFKTWCNTNYKKILDWFDRALKNENSDLVSSGELIETQEKKLGVFNVKTTTETEGLLKEANELYGLKKYLIEFTNMSTKEAMEVHMWNEYLIYAQIFGIAEKVAKQFKKLYPEQITDYDYDNTVFIYHIANTGITSASTARSRAESYSAGGGGFSSGGGGGGSFGGGGGGGSR